MTMPQASGLSRRQLALELGHNPSHAAADFIVGEGNQLAHAHIMAFPKWSGPLTLIEGPASAGKSHLARIWAEVAGAQEVRPETAEALAREGGVQPLVIDDVDRTGFAEAALFHLLNQSMRDRRPVLMTAREPVAAWPYTTNDVRSRARLAAHFRVELSDDIQLSQMFVKLFDDRQVAVDPRIIAYLVARMERSSEEAVALVDLMDRIALERGTAINRAVASEALRMRSAIHDDGQMEFSLEGGARDDE